MNYVRMIREKVGHDLIFLNGASGIVLNDRNQILLQLRSDINRWGFLGGYMELGESAEEGVLREIKEESGLDVAVEYLQGIYTKYFDSYPNGDRAQVVSHVFVCRIWGGRLDGRNDETLELKFFNMEEIPALANEQHADVWRDFIHGRRGVYR